MFKLMAANVRSVTLTSRARCEVTTAPHMLALPVPLSSSTAASTWSIRFCQATCRRHRSRCRIITSVRFCLTRSIHAGWTSSHCQREVIAYMQIKVCLSSTLAIGSEASGHVTYDYCV